MPNHRNRFPGRRRFLKQSTALTATVVALPLPRLAAARSRPTPPQESGRNAPPVTGATTRPQARRRGGQKK